METRYENYIMNDELVEISIFCNQQAGLLEIRANYDFKKSIYSSQEYKQIKAHIDTIIKKFNQELILKKIKK